MANKGLIGVQMSTIAPAKMPHFDAYESMGKPVSYTHLDVYKRQPLPHSMTVMSSCWIQEFELFHAFPLQEGAEAVIMSLSEF